MILLATMILTLRLRHWILLELRTLIPMSFLIEFLKMPVSGEVFGRNCPKATRDEGKEVAEFFGGGRAK